MNATAILIAVSYSLVVALGAIVAILAWRSTRSRRAADPERLARRERNWLVIVIAGLVALLFATIFFTPYGDSAPAGDRQVVRVTAAQFAWKLEPAVVRAGTPVEFRLTSIDVNHGFGVYDPDDRFVFQVQVMPEETQTAVHTFSKPGVYRILCLEFCGFLHHGMQGQFEVTAR